MRKRRKIMEKCVGEREEKRECHGFMIATLLWKWIWWCQPHFYMLLLLTSNFITLWYQLMGFSRRFMTKVKCTKFSFKLIWKNFPLIHYVMIHKTINTYYLNKSYNSLSFIVKLWIIFSTRYLMDLEKSFQSGIVLPKLENHLGKYYLRSMVLEEERSDCSKKRRKEKGCWHWVRN